MADEKVKRPRRSRKKKNPAGIEYQNQPISWRGTDIVPQTLIDIWREADRTLRNRTKRIEDARAFRRKDPKSLVRVNARWARLNPEGAALARLTLPQRTTLERDLIARVGSADPVFEREPLGFLESDDTAAEACAAYLNEWRLRSIPTKVFAGKSVEDGEFGRVTLPCDLDMDGSPDYFEYISDAAYEQADEDEKASYSRDDDDKRRRYVKRDADGERAVKERYRSRPLSDDEDKLDADAKNTLKDKRAKEALQKHQDDVTQYILRKGLDASATRVIPALDCRPILKRGVRKDRYEVVGLIERVLMETWELIEAGYGWDHLGDRLNTPRASRDDGTSVSAGDVGTNSQWYLYTLYITTYDDERTCHPLILSCVGGAGTWEAGTDADDPKSVHVIDLYKEYKIQGALWSYHFATHGEDDDPDYYARPYMTDLMDLVRAMEAEQGAARVATWLNSLTGYVHTPDPNMPDEATIETNGALRTPQIPGPGEIVSAAGKVVPFQQAQLTPDFWRMIDGNRIALAEATAIDTVQGGSGPSGHALLVQQTLGTIAKRQDRECVLEAAVACAESLLMILNGIWEKYGIRWPIRTTQERPIKDQPRTAKAPAVFDPLWVKDGQFNVAAEWPNEANLAMVDLLASLAERGFSNFEAVQHALGEQDPNNERKKVIKDLYFKHPVVMEMAIQKLAEGRGDTEVVKVLKMLQDEQKMTRAGVPGAKNGLPTSAVPKGGKASIAQSVRGGITGAEQRGAQMSQDAETAMQSGGQVMAGAA